MTLLFLNVETSMIPEVKAREFDSTLKNGMETQERTIYKARGRFSHRCRGLNIHHFTRTVALPGQSLWRAATFAQAQEEQRTYCRIHALSPLQHLERPHQFRQRRIVKMTFFVTRIQVEEQLHTDIITSFTSSDKL